MFGLLVVTRMMFSMSKVGKLASSVGEFHDVVDAALNAQKLAKLQAEQALGFNREEEAFYKTKGISLEKLYAFRIRAETLPPGFEKALQVDVTGEFVFKIGEWVELGNWLNGKYTDAVTGRFDRHGRDGRWLLHYGRERWKDESLRLQALRNVLDDYALVGDVPSILRQEL
jgi:hypothetical protein